jgi:hypothetical protein
LALEEKKPKIQEFIIEKQLDYFKCKKKSFKAITSFINVMSMILHDDKGKQFFFPKQDYDQDNKENAY